MTRGDHLDAVEAAFGMLGVAVICRNAPDKIHPEGWRGGPGAESRPTPFCAVWGHWSANVPLRVVEGAFIGGFYGRRWDEWPSLHGEFTRGLWAALGAQAADEWRAARARQRCGVAAEDVVR